MKKRYRAAALGLAAAALAVCLTGCGNLWTTALSKLKGELVGNNYTITSYDNYGNLTFTVYGDRIAMDCELDENGEPSSYIDITIDGQEWQHVGGTLVFAQRGVDMITDFQTPEDMEVEGGNLGLIGADRVVNDYRNKFGKKLVVLVSSQNGTPIGLFQGNDCYTEIPGDLPKTTLINIDGKLVYVHRANVDIFPAKLFNN
ncbi:MAG: DUF5052 family protein [Clostridia bacterium]|nr:DUF5052 family protein [Clostridia bacterium]